jgi:hypothetical protein
MSKYLKTEDREFFGRIQSLAHRLATLCELTCMIEPKRRPLADGTMGLCNYEEKRISLKVRSKDRADDGGKWWPRRDGLGDILVTVAHEVAHLIHPNHSMDFKSEEYRMCLLLRTLLTDAEREALDAEMEKLRQHWWKKLEIPA